MSMSNGPLTQAKVESEIMRISDEMERAVEQLAQFAQEAAISEVDYKVAYAKERLRIGSMAITDGIRLTEADKDARATVECEFLLRSRLVNAAHHEVAQENLRSMRSRMDSLRTISANIRAQT